jgi:carboxyl-terminal processing protease
LKQRAQVLGQPAVGAAVVGFLDVGAVAKRLGSFGSFVKLGLGAGRFGFVEAALVDDAAGAAETLKFQALMSHSPPLLDVAPSALSTRDSKIRITGVARDSDQVLDTYMFVGSQKVFYQSNRKGADHRAMPFDQEVQLNPGVNVITVVSRENEDVATSYTMVVRRDGSQGEALPTPKGQAFAEDWAFTGSAE